MNPNVDKQPGLELPQPSVEQVFGAQSTSATGPEKVLSNPETQTTQQTLQEPASAMDPAPVGPPPVPALDPAAIASAGAQQAASSPGDSSNTDELDRQWIQKAKMIVAQTKANPYIESHELGRVKADYMKIRYNKEIKIPEDIR